MTESFLLTPVYKKVSENGDYSVFCEDALICVNDVVRGVIQKFMDSMYNMKSIDSVSMIFCRML